MQAYIIRRLILIIPTLFIASLIVFFMIRLIPGDVIELMEAQHGGVGIASKVNRAQIEHNLGLDVPIHVQYGRWLGDMVLHGSLGESLWKKMPVTGLIIDRLPVTLELAILALLVALIISIPIGIYSAIRQDTGGDYIGRTISILSISLPDFWVGTMIMVFPALWWGWSPPVILIPFVKDPIGNLQMFIIPAVVMSMLVSGSTMRLTRTMMLEVLRQDYIRTAWSKGIRERVIIMRHALKNALIPVVTLQGAMLPVLIGGAVITEQIFCLPGVGRLMLNAIFQRDYPIVSGVTLILAIFVVIINLVVDLTYGFLDPRVQYR
jgi:peptide/nickel transport system permease protein